MNATAAGLYAIAISVSASAAEVPLLGIPGDALYQDELSGVPAGWTVGKGKWGTVNGALCGAELAEDHHGAVLRKALPMSDVIIEFEVKLDGARGASLSINDAHGHLARLAVAPGALRVTKDDHDKDGPDQPVVFGALKADIQPGVWTAVRLEIVGDTMLGRAGGAVAVGLHEQLRTPKTNLGLTVAGQTASFRRLRVWTATPNPSWETVKASLPRGEPLTPPARRVGASR